MINATAVEKTSDVEAPEGQILQYWSGSLYVYKEGIGIEDMEAIVLQYIANVSSQAGVYGAFAVGNLIRYLSLNPDEQNALWPKVLSTLLALRVKNLVGLYQEQGKDMREGLLMVATPQLVMRFWTDYLAERLIVVQTPK